MSSVTLNGNTYTDDASATTGLANGGHRTRLVPMLSDAVVDLAAKQSAAAASQTAAAASQTAAAASASAAATSASNAATSETNIALTELLFLGSKTLDPVLDNDGNALLAGAIYYNSVANETRVWTGSVWKAAGSAVNGTSKRANYTATASQTTFTVTGGYDAGFADVYLNGVKLINGVDVDVSSGTGFVLAVGAAAGDVVDFIGYGAFVLASAIEKPAVDGTTGQILTATGTGAPVWSDAPEGFTLAQAHAISLSF
jgi:hypothetical protein